MHQIETTIIRLAFRLSLVLLPLAGMGGVQLPDSIPARLQHMENREKVNYLIDISWQLRESDRHLSVACGELAIRMADSLKFRGEEAKAANMLGASLLFYHSDIHQALAYFNRSLKIAMEIRDSVQIGYAYNNLGDVYSQSGNVPLAHTFADSSLHYFTQLKQPEGMAYAYINLGQVYLQQKDFSAALNYYQQALDLYVHHRSQNIVSTCNMGMARVYKLTGNYEKALYYYRQDLALNKRAGNKSFEATTLTEIGNILCRQQKCVEALDHYNQAMVLFSERDYDYGRIAVHLGRAITYAHMNQKQAGEAELDAALKLAGKLELSSQILEVQKTRLQFYAALANEPLPDSLIESFVAAYDSVFLVNQYQTLSEINKRQELAASLVDISDKYILKKRQSVYALILSLLFLGLLGLLFLKFRSHARLTRKLEVASAGKDRLLSIISHDLRNPFVAIIQYLDLLRADMLPEQERKAFIDQLEALTSNTYALLENLLNFSDFRRSEVRFKPAVFELPGLLGQIRSNLDAQLAIKNVGLETELKAVRVFGDMKLIEIVLRNLISNAVKYSNPGDVVMVRSAERSAEVTIEVADSGTGMSREVLDTLFSEEFQASKPGTMRESGTGIGLKICREFIAIHRGKLTIDSEPGKGSIFRVHLPKQ